MAIKWTILDNAADPYWVKTITPLVSTAIPEEAIQYDTQGAASTDCNTLNVTYPGRFHVGQHPKPH